MWRRRFIAEFVVTERKKEKKKGQSVHRVPFKQSIGLAKKFLWVFPTMDRLEAGVGGGWVLGVRGEGTRV